MKTTRFFAALLVLALLLGLAGCGQDRAEDPRSPAAAPASAPAAGGETGGYGAAFTPLCSGLRRSVTPLLYAREGFYALVNEQAGRRPLGEGVTEAYEGQYALYEARLSFIGYDGQLRPLSDYSPAYQMENTGGWSGFSSTGSLSALIAGPEGELLALETGTVSYYDGPPELTQADEGYWDHFVSQQHTFLRRLDENGGELGRAELDLTDCRMMNEGWVADPQGNLVLSYYAQGGGSVLLALTADGSPAYRLTADGSIDGLIRLRDGRPAAVVSQGDKLVLQAVDAQTGAFAESVPLPDGAANLLNGGGDYDYYYTGGSTLYGCSLKDGEPAPLFNWLDCGVSASALSGPTVEADGSILAVENRWTGDQVAASLVTLRPGAAGTGDKQVLTLAALGLDRDLQSAIAAFNRENPDYRLQVLDYSQDSETTGLSAEMAAVGSQENAGLTRLTTELLSGQMPDLLALSGLPYDQLAAKGLLEDLYPYLDADESLKREDFFPSVLRAMEVGGGLYEVCPYFSVRSAIGARTVVGDRDGWTYDELYAALATLPEGSAIFSSDMTKTDALSRCLSVNMDSLVDWANGTCRFDSEDFIALLDFADRFPDRAPEESGEAVQLLRAVTVSEFRNPAVNEVFFGGEGSTVYVGYPSADGSCGSAIELDAGFAMSAACAHKEAAWAFLRTFMTASFQTNTYKLPTNRSQFEALLAQAMVPTYVLDESGNYVLDADGQPKQQPLMEYNGFPVYCTTQAQADQLRALVENCTKAVRPAAGDILSIIQDDAQSYFSGQKTAQEAASLIQSKVSLYMNEQR